MRKWLLTLCAIVVVGLAPAAIRAQVPADAEKAAAVKELLDAFNFARTLRDASAAMKGILIGQLPQTMDQFIAADSRFSPEQKAKARAQIKSKMQTFLPKAEDQLSAMFNSRDYLAETEAAMAAYYLGNHSLPEIREITAFHRTSTGQKLLRLAPQAMNEAMKTVLPKWSTRWQQHIVDLVRAEVAQMAAN